MQTHNRHFFLLLASIFFLVAPTSWAQMESHEKTANIEVAKLFNSGTANDGIYSTAVRFGASADFSIPMHTTLDFGFLENDRRKYIRFNMFGVGLEPDLNSPHFISGYLRADLLCATLAETGYWAYTPGLEAGAVFHFVTDLPIVLSLRHSSDLGDPRNSVSTIILGAMIGLDL